MPLRERAGLTIEQAVQQLRTGSGAWSRSKLGRIETRAQGVRIREIEQLLDLYNVTDAALRVWLLDLAATAQERGYWLAIRKDLPEDFHGKPPARPPVEPASPDACSPGGRAGSTRQLPDAEVHHGR
ncbi:MAG: helix-turn-helix domain-containing protein [Pseudonocardiaceae bacterium]